MLFDNLPLPMPWYPKLLMQDRFRQNVTTNIMHLQLAPYDGLLPFQLRKSANSEYPISWKIMCASNGKIEDYLNGYEDEEVVDMSAYIVSNLSVNTLDSMDVITFKNLANSSPLITGSLPDGLPSGVYYMQMEFTEGADAGTWVSELFRVPENRFSWDDPTTCNFLCFKWYHDSDLAPIHYFSDNSFYSLLYLDTFITASEPEIILLDPIRDGYDEIHKTLTKGVIKYRVSSFVPDFIKVALFIMQMHDKVYFTTEMGIRTGEIKNIDVSATLSDDGAYSTVEVIFEQMSLLTDSNCENDMAAPIIIDPTDGQTLTTTLCDATGAVYARIAAGFAAGYFGVLFGRVGLGSWVQTVPYISRAALTAGWNGVVAPASGFTSFKIVYGTFSGLSGGESAVSIPTPSC